MKECHSPPRWSEWVPGRSISLKCWSASSRQLWLTLGNVTYEPKTKSSLLDGTKVNVLYFNVHVYRDFLISTFKGNLWCLPSMPEVQVACVYPHLLAGSLVPGVHWKLYQPWVISQHWCLLVEADCRWYVKKKAFSQCAEWKYVIIKLVMYMYASMI